MTITKVIRSLFRRGLQRVNSVPKNFKQQTRHHRLNRLVPDKNNRWDSTRNLNLWLKHSGRKRRETKPLDSKAVSLVRSLNKYLTAPSTRRQRNRKGCLKNPVLSVSMILRLKRPWEGNYWERRTSHVPDCSAKVALCTLINEANRWRFEKLNLHLVLKSKSEATGWHV